MGAEKSLLNMGVIVPSVFFSNLPSSENVPPFFLCPLTSPNPHPSVSRLSPHISPLLSSAEDQTNRDGSSLIISHQKERKKRLMEKVFFGGGSLVGREASFVLHLFQEVVEVVVDPTSSSEPLCTLCLPKRVPLLPSSPPPPPPSASLLKQTLWTACMTFQLCGWHSRFTASPTVHRAPKAQQQRNLDPWIHLQMNPSCPGAWLCPLSCPIST